MAWALRIGALCNTASLGHGPDGQSGAARTGDPMEIALLAVARDAGLPRGDLLDDHRRVQEHAFDPDAKMMATVHGAEDGHVFAVKGAPEAVIAACDKELGPEGPRPLDDAGRTEWERRNAAAAREGLAPPCAGDEAGRVRPTRIPMSG